MLICPVQGTGWDYWSFVHQSVGADWLDSCAASQTGFSRSHRTHSQTSPPDGSDTDTEDLTIQPGSSVKFQVRDNNPGLFIATSKYKSWTPIAARIRAHVRTYAKPVK